MNRGDIIELAVTVLYSCINVGVVVLVMGALLVAGFGPLVGLPAGLLVGLVLAVLGAVAISAWRD